MRKTGPWIPLITLVVLQAACSGGTGATAVTTSTPVVANASLAGAVVDGKVSGATLTVYSDQAMTTQVGSGTTDAAGAFNITLTVTTAPDPVYIKSEGGTDLDTGMPAPTMEFVGNTGGANQLTTFNVTPLTSAVFTKVKNGSTLANAQTAAQTQFGLASNTGTNGLYEDPSAAANTALKAAEFKQLTSGTMGSTLAAGDYDLYLISFADDDLWAAAATPYKSAITQIADFYNAQSIGRGIYADLKLTVDANGNITATGGGSTFSGKVQGSAILMDATGTDIASGKPDISRVVGKIGVNGSVSGNFSYVIPQNNAMHKGIFVGSFVPVSGVTQAALNTFVTNYLTPGATTGKVNFVARSIFTSAGYNGGPPRVTFGQTAFTAYNTSTGAITMGDVTAHIDTGSTASPQVVLKFCGAQYITDPTSGKPTNLVISLYEVANPATSTTYYGCTNPTGHADLSYQVSAVGARRGIGVTVGQYKPGTTTANTAGNITDIADAFLDKVDSLAPSGFATGLNDVTVAHVDADMPGQTRSAVLTAGLAPSALAGGFTVPGGITTNNGYWDPNSATPAPELLVFQGSILAMKKDIAGAGTNNNDFADNGDHLRVMQFYESGAMQGEEIIGGNLPISGVKARNDPSTFVGFVHPTGTTVTYPTGTRNFLARTIYAQNYAQFTSSYVSGTLTITKAPTATATGTATAVVTPHGGTASTVTLTIDALASGTYGMYHMYGPLGSLYIDITWPVGGTKALYAISNNATGTGTVTDVGEAFLTL